MSEEERFQEIEKQLEIIKQRNARVEANKAWEASRVRIASICLVTYIFACVLLWALGAEKFWLDALVPPLGFFLSTRSIRLVKRWWIASQYKPS